MTNTSLIAVFNGTISNQAVQLCNARDLHAFLEVGKEYANWIKDRIADYGFIQDEDYIIVTERTHGRPRKEYHITLDMGKELGMVERNERGRQIRRYFIECEKRQLQNAQPNLPLVEPEPTYSFDFTEYELEQLAWLAFSHKQMNDLLEILIQPMDAIGSRYSAMVYSHHHEYKRHYSESLDTIRRLIEPFKQSQRMNWERVIKRLN